MVSAAKLRRAQERIIARAALRRTGRWPVLRSLAARANPERTRCCRSTATRRVELVVLTADKGLCGAFNAGIIRTAETLRRRAARPRASTLAAVGKKGRDYFAPAPRR